MPFDTNAKPPKGAIPNPHKATVVRAFAYQMQRPKPGYVWYIYTVKGMGFALNKKKQLVKQARTKVQGLQIPIEFEQTHGEVNVKNMIIVNIINKVPNHFK